MENLVEFESLFSGIYLNKRVLVTGNTGFKGSWLCLWLQKMGAKVYGIAKEPITELSHFELLKSDYSNDYVDINDFSLLEQSITSFSPEIIFHLAAQPIVRQSYLDPLETFNTNILGTANILEISRKCPELKAIINVTTDKCYQNKEQNYYYKEEDALGGHDPYSSSKACSEIITQSMRLSMFPIEKYGAEHSVLIATARAGNVIGGGDWSADRLIPDLVTKANKNNTTVIRSPRAIRPWQHVLESLSGYLLIGKELLLGNKNASGAWNIGPEMDANLSVEQIIENAKRTWMDIKVDLLPINELHEAELLMLDNNKIKSILKWDSVWNAELAIEKTINWYKTYYENSVVRTEIDLQDYISDAKNKKVIWV